MSLNRKLQDRIDELEGEIARRDRQDRLNYFPNQPPPTGDPAEMGWTVDGIMTLLDAHIEGTYNKEGMTIEDARLTGALLSNVPSWATEIVEHFAGVPRQMRQFFDVPMTQRTLDEVQARLNTYEAFADVVHIVGIDGLPKRFNVVFGPPEVSGFSIRDAKFTISLPMRVDIEGS